MSEMVNKIKERKLTDKQARFVDEYMIDSNATQAAIRAGFAVERASEQGYQLLQKTTVSEAIEKKQNQRSKKLGIDAEWVLQKLKENINRSMQAEPVLDREGNEIGQYQYNGSVANKALELIGKHLGMFVEVQKNEYDIKTAVIILPPNPRDERNTEQNRIPSTTGTADRSTEE